MMNEQELEEVCQEIWDSLIEGISVKQQLQNLVVKYPVECRDEIEEAFWYYYDMVNEGE